MRVYWAINHQFAGSCSGNFVAVGGGLWTTATLGDQAGEFCWQLWTATLTVADPGSEICVRATDSRGNSMPESVPWNPKGYLYDAWHRVAMSRLLNQNSEQLFILHAARNDAMDFLAIVPSPPQLIFQLDTFSTGGEG